MTTKCDIIRDAGRATLCGLCSHPGDPLPDGCAAYDPPPNPAACKVPGAANALTYLFAARAAPPARGDANKAARTQSIAVYETSIAATEQALMGAYGVDEATASISWPDFERCLWNADGLPGGVLSHKYFGRFDVGQMGFKPGYPLGGKVAEEKVWSDPTSPSPTPLSIDYLINPSLFTILVIAFLVVVLGALIWRALRDTRRADRASARASEAAAEAKRRAAGIFPDPQVEECREYVETLEKQGFDMAYYRRRCGLGPSPD